MWLADTGADEHVTGNLNNFVGELSQLPPGYFVKQVQGELPINLKGLVRIISVAASGKNSVVDLNDCLYVPGMSINIFSLQKLRRLEGSYSLSGKPGQVVPLLNS